MVMGFLPLSMLTKPAPLTLVPKCQECGLYKTCESPKMPASGGGRAKALIVGEAPGAREDAKGIQFVGKAGERLRASLRKIGVDPDKDVWFHNAIICRPPENKTPDQKKIDACRPNLVATVKRLNPEVIIPLGLVAVKSVLGWLWKEDVSGDSMEKWVGWRVPHQGTNTWICPTYHPSHVMRAEEEGKTVVGLFFERHLEAAFGCAGRPWKEVPDFAKQVVCIHKPGDVRNWLNGMVRPGRPASFDLETNMLKPDNDKARIVCCAVSTGGDTVSFPWHGDAIDATLAVLWDARVPKMGWNIKFEERWIRRLHGRGVKGWLWDGMQAAHAIDNREGITGLKFQAFVQLGQDVYDGRVAPFLKADYANDLNKITEVRLADLLVYCGVDALLEHKVGRIQRKVIGYDD